MALPLAILTVLKPDFGIIAVILAFLPSIILVDKVWPIILNGVRNEKRNKKYINLLLKTRRPKNSRQNNLR